MFTQALVGPGVIRNGVDVARHVLDNDGIRGARQPGLERNPYSDSAEAVITDVAHFQGPVMSQHPLHREVPRLRVGSVEVRVGRSERRGVDAAVFGRTTIGWGSAENPSRVGPVHYGVRIIDVQSTGNAGEFRRRGNKGRGNNPPSGRLAGKRIRQLLRQLIRCGATGRDQRNKERRTERTL